MKRKVHILGNGDLRQSANQRTWPEQDKLESQIQAALAAIGVESVRVIPYNSSAGHGLIGNLRQGLDVLGAIPLDAPIILAEAVWQYSHHLLQRLYQRQLMGGAPVLLAANDSGVHPGIVGLLNLAGSCTKAGIRYSRIWSVDYSDELSRGLLREWLTTGTIRYDLTHIHDLDRMPLPGGLVADATEFARQFQTQGHVLLLWDRMCMGMFNADLPDQLLWPLGIAVQCESQADLLAEMSLVTGEEAETALQWTLDRGMQYRWGLDPVEELTREQTLEQWKMYIAARRIAARHGASVVGIQYQQGLARQSAASDLAEGALNSLDDAPPVFALGTDTPVPAVPNCNEVDMRCGVDLAITVPLWRQFGWAPQGTLHDVRWIKDDIVILLISGAAPPAHFAGGWAGAESLRQPKEYFPRGGGTVRGISKPGNVVGSSIWMAPDGLHMDLVAIDALELPREETEERWRLTTPPWPIMHGRYRGVTTPQIYASSWSNHINVHYVPGGEDVFARGFWTKAAVAQQLGFKVHILGTPPDVALIKA